MQKYVYFFRLVAKYHVQRPWALANVLHLLDLHSSSNQDFIAKCNIVREVLKDLYEQNEKPSIETLGSLMHEVRLTFVILLVILLHVRCVNASRICLTLEEMRWSWPMWLPV